MGNLHVNIVADVGLTTNQFWIKGIIQSTAALIAKTLVGDGADIIMLIGSARYITKQASNQ